MVGWDAKSVLLSHTESLWSRQAKISRSIRGLIAAFRRKSMARVVRVLIQLFSFSLVPLLTGGATLPVLEIKSDGARPDRLVFPKGEISFHGQRGGFEVVDFKAHRATSLREGVVERRPDGSQFFRAQAEDLLLEASFIPKADGSVRVNGLLRNATGKDRAIILRYVLPMTSDSALFDCDLGESQQVGRATEPRVGTIFPIATMTQTNLCLALAIPPTFPCCFGMTGAQQGLGVEFYLGLVVETKRFPNQARFEFLIFAAEAGWPFRSALARYYELFPEYYMPRGEGGGLWNKHEPGNIDVALPLYRFQVLMPRELPPSEIQRRKDLGLLSFYYLLVGNRKVKGLSAPPTNYGTAMKAFEDYGHREVRKSPDQTRPEMKATADLIARSACKSADGRYVLHKVAKGDTGAEGDKEGEDAPGPKAAPARKNSRRAAKGESNELTFIVNPNPDLFADQGQETVGGLTMAFCKKQLETAPLDGFEFDSLGGRWPAHLNFRRDHFPYARYPLTFDEQGWVALHNCISHYECIETLRTLTRERGQYLFGNGIYTYARKSGADNYEHYNSRENGRFFLAALLDVLGRENSALFERKSLEQMRAMAGRKLFTMVMYKWDDPQLVHAQMNRNLVYGVFGTPSDKQTGYVNSPAFARDREVLEWSVKNCRLLQTAGWEPATHAHVNSPDVGCERYGNGDTVYFALNNFANEPHDCELTIDLTALAMPTRRAGSVRMREIARKSTIATEIEGGKCHVRLWLRPDEAQIVEVQRVP